MIEITIQVSALIFSFFVGVGVGISCAIGLLIVYARM